MIEYDAGWKIDARDPGYGRYIIAQKLIESSATNGHHVGMQGGLDHIEIGRDVVRFFDRGSNGLCVDISANIKTGVVREIHRKY